MRKLSFKFQFLWLVLLGVPALGRGLSDGTESAGATTTDNVCLVCGEGGEIDNSSRMIFTSIGMFTCGGLAGAGIHGNIPTGQCSSAQAVALEKCGCILSGETTLNEEAEEPLFCHICPMNGVVTIPEGVVSLPGEASNKTCADFLDAAVNGLLDDDQCETLQNFTNETCGCVSPEEVEDLNRPDASNTTFVCPVCGVGMTSSTPNATVVIPGQSTVRTCAQFERAAASGKISEQQCSMVSLFVEKACNCQTGAPVTPPPTRSPSAYDCQICGDGNIVTNSEGIVTIPTQPNRTCEALMRANEAGNINANQCLLLQPFVKSPCGCTPIGNTTKPTVQPTAAPSLSPTIPRQPTISPAPTGWVTQKQDCFDTLAEIYEIEKELDDVTVRRRYILCGGTTFHLGHLSDDGRIINGDAFLMPRPNVLYQCGKSGSRSNNCVLKGGDFGLVSFYGVYEGIYETVENVKIQGLTFQSQTLFAAVMEAAGDIEFIDCAFKVSKSLFLNVSMTICFLLMPTSSRRIKETWPQC